MTDEEAIERALFAMCAIKVQAGSGWETTMHVPFFGPMSGLVGKGATITASVADLWQQRQRIKGVEDAAPVAAATDHGGVSRILAQCGSDDDIVVIVRKGATQRVVDGEPVSRFGIGHNRDMSMNEIIDLLQNGIALALERAKFGSPPA